MKANSRFQSFLAPDIERFIAHKRSLGRRYDVEEKTLALLDSYLRMHRVSTLKAITPKFVDQFLLSRPRARPRSYNHLRCTLARLFAYLVNQERITRTPVQSPPRRSRYQRTPFIFDATHARRLLAIARAFCDSGGTIERGRVYYLIFALLYGLGLRVGEVCRLCIADLDSERQLLVIRESKFYKSRLVPVGPKLGARLTEYLRWRHARYPNSSSPEQPLFCLRGGRAINPCTVSQTFHHLVPRLRLKIPPGVSPPRLHDLRHSSGNRIIPATAGRYGYFPGDRAIWDALIAA
ncbi:MAG: tyrosine-type recombinase/integrase [Steroidobacteraceae bacterium]